MEQKSQKNYIQYLYTKEGLKRRVEKVKQISSGMAVVQGYFNDHRDENGESWSNEFCYPKSCRIAIL